MNKIPIQLEAWESAPSPICTKLVNLDAAEQLLYQIMTLDYGYSDDDIRRLSGSETQTDESDKWSERLCIEEEAVVIECGGVYYENMENNPETTIHQAMEIAKDKADDMPFEQLSLVTYTDTQAEPIVRKFEENEVVFVNDIWEPDLRGFGKILIAEETTEDDNIVLCQVNGSGENHEEAGKIYKLAKGYICSRCGCVLCEEHHDFTNEDDEPGDHDYPLYCPMCDENFFYIEAEQTDQYDQCLHRSREEFEKMAKQYIKEQ